jgi:hypothetical protein
MCSNLGARLTKLGHLAFNAATRLVAAMVALPAWPLWLSRDAECIPRYPPDQARGRAARLRIRQSARRCVFREGRITSLSRSPPAQVVLAEISGWFHQLHAGRSDGGFDRCATQRHKIAFFEGGVDIHAAAAELIRAWLGLLEVYKFSF